MYGKQSCYPKYAATFDDNQITGAEPDVSGMNDNLITESWIVDFKSYQENYWNELKRKNENFVEHAQTRAVGFQFLLLDLVASGADSLKLLRDLPDIDAGGNEIQSLSTHRFIDYWQGDYKKFTKTLCNRSKNELVELSGFWIQIPSNHSIDEGLFFHEQMASTLEKEQYLKHLRAEGLSLNKKELLSDMTVYKVKQMINKESVCARHSCATSLPELLYNWAKDYTFKELYWRYLKSPRIIQKRERFVSQENKDAAHYRQETFGRWGHGQGCQGWY